MLQAQWGGIHGNPASGSHPCEHLPLDLQPNKAKYLLLSKTYMYTSLTFQKDKHHNDFTLL